MKIKTTAELNYQIALLLGYRFFMETRGIGDSSYTLAVLVRPGDRDPWEKYSRSSLEAARARYVEVTHFEQLKAGYFGSEAPQFTHSWKEMGVLIEKYGVGLLFDVHSKKWVASMSEDNTCCACNVSAKIAAALCLLKHLRKLKEKV